MSQAELSVEVPQVDDPLDSKTRFLEGKRWRVGTAAGLVATAAAATAAEKFNLISAVGGTPEDIIKSLRHPLIGYSAAWLSSLIAKKNKLITAFVTVTFADTLAQGGYALASDPDRNPTEIVAHDEIGETVKDYVFTLGGAVLYFLIRPLERLRNRNTI